MIINRETRVFHSSICISGLQLQLVVYMNAALELEEKRHPGKKAEPAGIFYYHIQNPIVDGLGNETEAEIRNSVLEQLKLNGLVNDDPEIYEAMDSDFAGNSSVIPIGKMDGSLKASSKVASTYDFSVMSDYVQEKIKETGKKIFAGDISIHPYSLDGKLAVITVHTIPSAVLTPGCRVIPIINWKNLTVRTRY